MSEKFIYSGFYKKNQKKDLLISTVLTLVFHIFLFIVWLPVVKYKIAVPAGDFIIIKPLAVPPATKTKETPSPQTKESPKPRKKLVPIPMPAPDEPKILEKQNKLPTPRIIKEIEADLNLGEIEAPPNYTPKNQNNDRENQKDGTYKTGDKGITSPKLIFKITPEYSDEAIKAKISGIITIEAIIMPNGEISDIKVIKGLGYGLDEKAVETISKWKFIPGMKNGKNVAVIILIDIYFTLQ